MRAALWLFCILLTSCANDGVASVKPHVDIEVVNLSSRDKDNVFARFGDYDCKWGYVGRTFTAGYGFYPHPITPQAELHWDAEGKHYVQKVDLSKIYPPGKSGRLTFTVRDAGVTATFTEKSE